MGIALRREPRAGLEPFALKNAPSFIERQFPVGRLSAEAYKERKAGAGQTLTALGSYWKGRKPLVLVRAVVLGCLLPATDDPAKDLDIFLKLMAMDDEGLARRVKSLKASDIDPDWVGFADIISTDSGKPKWLQRLDDETIDRIVSEWFPTIPYERRIRYCLRPEELDDSAYVSIWPEVNAHLGTDAHSLPDLVEQLGIARFGHRPKVADTFCGGGSIPFEAARIGCDVYASDLNPIACMLTWGGFNIIGTSKEKHAQIVATQKAAAAALDAEINRLGIEHDRQGNRAKVFLYCLETRCPKTGWMVPMAPSWVISNTRNVVAKLVPDEKRMCYDIEVHTGVSQKEMAEAALGTVRDGRLVHPMNPERSGVDLKTIRGDYKDDNGTTQNRLRRWELDDFMPRPGDIYQERLYAIQWVTKASIGKGREKIFFTAVTGDDLKREQIVADLVRNNLAEWQRQGLVPDMLIEPGANTTQPIWERGWTHWHHLFNGRNLLGLALLRKAFGPANLTAHTSALPIALDNASRLCGWNKGHAGSGEFATNVFNNQSFNTHMNYACRSVSHIASTIGLVERCAPVSGRSVVQAANAKEFAFAADLFVTDPPYADAVNYHEITEFFIAWLRTNPPPPFDQWTWDSKRHLAIRGKDEEFRRAMVEAYASMTRQMPNNGLQVVMFTHQDAGVWADLGAILWAAGLRVTGAWNVVTETQSALKEGNYVQGTICLVLRKRLTRLPQLAAVLGDFERFWRRK